MNILRIRMRHYIKDVFFRQNFRDPIYPTALKKVIDNHNTFTSGTDSRSDFVIVIPLTGKNTILMSINSRTKSLYNIKSIRPNKQKRLFFNICSAEKRS